MTNGLSFPPPLSPALPRPEPAPSACRPCPVCGETAGDVAGPPGGAFHSEVGGKVFEHPAYAVVRCSGCGHYYKTATPSEARLKEYYQTATYSQWDTDGLFPTERRLLRELDDLPRGSRVLDFGCGSGRILGSVADRFRCFGLEINRVSAAAAAARGLTMLSEDELYDPAGEGFDAILLIDVFEHLPCPLSKLRDLAARLRPGGRLALVTGNADAPACRKDPANFWYFRVYGHLQMLSRAGGRYLERALGLRLRTWIEMSHYEPFPWAQRASMAAKDWAYDVFHRDGHAIARRLLRWVPYFGRAEHWSQRPLRGDTADHVVAVYEKSASPTQGGSSPANGPR